MSLRLIGDIGGTHARFALCEPGSPPQDPQKLVVAEHAGVAEAAQAYLASRPVAEAVFAVACPVVGDEVAFTNSPWHFNIPTVRDQLGLRHLSVINDFAAQAQAIPHLETADLRPLKPGTARPGAPIVVLGPGTGLGVAFLVRNGRGMRVLPSEGGHASFSPQDDLQAEILRLLRREYGHVSAERLLSGPGLLHIANALAEIRGDALRLGEPKQVSERAAAGQCTISQEALKLFAAILGATAGNLALTVLAEGGVYVAGGLCRNLGPLLDVAALTHSFQAKGRFAAYLSGVPIFQVMRPHTGLLGAAHFQHDVAEV